MKNAYFITALVFLFIALCIFCVMMVTGCKPPKNAKHYTYCWALSSEHKVIDRTDFWVVHCFDGANVYFPKKVEALQEVFYTPYVIDESTTAVYGYIQAIHDIVP